MSITTYGPGDEQTWGSCVGHPNDPRTEVDEDEEGDDFDEQREREDWMADRIEDDYRDAQDERAALRGGAYARALGETR